MLRCHGRNLFRVEEREKSLSSLFKLNNMEFDFNKKVTLTRFSNESKLARYIVKTVFILAILILLYLVSAIAEGSIKCTIWSPIGSTVFYILSMVVIINVVTDKS